MKNYCGAFVNKSRMALKWIRPYIKRFILQIFQLARQGLRFGGRAWKSWLDRPAGRRSLRLRFTLFFSCFLVVVWLLAALLSWKECREYIAEFFDSQQMLFAGRLATVDFSSGALRLPRVELLLPGVKSRARGKLDDDVLAFAVFTKQGRPVLNDGREGRHFVFNPGAYGFVETQLKGEREIWRILWAESTNGEYLIAVGQEKEFRRDLALAMLSSQIIPWLFLLPILFLGLVFLLSRELAPLRGVAEQLRGRSPEDGAHLETTTVPSECRPLVEALNGLFSRINTLIQRERTFISDAAHELRTPLASLRVQTQVAQQSEDDPDVLRETLANLLLGIDRSSRLVEQLLVLSRLESGFEPRSTEEYVDWRATLREYMQIYRDKTAAKHLDFSCDMAAHTDMPPGNPELIKILLRNLLDNAATYSPAGGSIAISFDADRLLIKNTCGQFPAEYAARLGERFFRPPGQDAPGSGLGLSIVRRITEIHGFGLEIAVPSSGGQAAEFAVSIYWKSRRA